MQLLERENVHKRPDFEHAIPIGTSRGILPLCLTPGIQIFAFPDIFEGSMTKEKRDLIFQKAGSKLTPMLFIDDEYIGTLDGAQNYINGYGDAEERCGAWLSFPFSLITPALPLLIPLLFFLCRLSIRRLEEGLGAQRVGPAARHAAVLTSKRAFAGGGVRTCLRICYGTIDH